MRIDAHQHFWCYNAAEFGWIDERMAAIRRDCLPVDLKRETALAGIDGVISVQARQLVAETEWLLELARENDFIKGVVGWLPLVAPDVREKLARFAADRKLRGLRHVVQGEADEQFLQRADFNRGVAVLGEFGLAYDILIVERQLPAAIAFVDRHPRQSFVLDHIGKPRIVNHVLSPWREHIRELARRPNVFCKVSGMVTEADYDAWREPELRGYFEIVLEAFGSRRLMLGSDWPVCTVACTYPNWFEMVGRWIAALSETEQARIAGGTAQEVYRL